jgi:glycosyltransferase involved in cell wall biosynthesis
MSPASRARPYVLHLIHCLAPGGAARAALELAVHSESPSTILSLTPARSVMLAEARAMDVAVVDYSSMADLLARIDAADIVLVHTWNTPELFGLLIGQLPPVRLSIWVHIAGRAVPQVVPGIIVQRADAVVATSERSLAHIRDAATGGPIEPRVILPLRNLDAFSNVARRRSERYRVAYVGALDGHKLHADVIAQIARIDAPGLRFTFIGDGPWRTALGRQAAESSAADAIAFCGWVGDMPAALADVDVLAVPMPGSADLAIMEAMAAGIPPVILSPEGTSDLVTDGVDGIVTERHDQFIAALSALGCDARRRKFLGAAARATAMTRFDPRHTARAFDALWEAMLNLPKHGRAAVVPATDSDRWRHGRGAELACLAYADHWSTLAGSLSRDSSVASAADAAIASAPELVLAPAAGGLMHYLSAHPNDPWLAFWCGLVFSGIGLPLRAAAMFERSRSNGFPDACRLEEHASATAGQIGAVSPVTRIADIVVAEDALAPGASGALSGP